MKRYKTILVPFRSSQSDTVSVSWASKISHLADTDKVIFVHVTQITEIPKNAAAQYPLLKQPLDEAVIDEMQAFVDENWSGHPETQREYLVSKNLSHPVALLKAIMERNCDLVIINKAIHGDDLAVRLARKATCSVMCLPEQAPVLLDSILVSTDFSDNSLAALEVARTFAQAEGLESVDCLHVCTLGDYLHKVTFPEVELKALAEEFAKDNFKHFQTKVPSHTVPIKPIIRTNKQIGVGVLKYANEADNSLIVASSRGRHNLTALLLGSNAEELVRLSNRPIIVAKVKGTGKKLLSELLGI